MLVHDFLMASAGLRPDSPAIRQGDDICTYRQLAAAAESVAAWLLQNGLEPGERVATLFEKSIANVAAMYGVWRAGGVLVNLNDKLPTIMLALVLRDCRPRFLLGSSKSLRHIVSTNESLPPTLEAFVTLEGAPPESTHPRIKSKTLNWRGEARFAAATPRTNDDLCTIIYTSGSTGRQKGVMWSHRNLVHHVKGVTTYLNNTADDRLISVLPLYFGYGLSQLLTSVGAGACLSLAPSFTYPNEIVDVLERNKITGLAGVPAHFEMLLGMTDLASRDLKTLRYFTISGARSSETLVGRLRKVFPNVRLYLMFGQTESTIRISFLDPMEVDRRPTSIGKPMPEVQVFVLDEHGHPVPDGEVGELVCQGANVMLGYWDDPELTARVVRPHPLSERARDGEKVLYTGDMVRRDAEGFLYFMGRKDEMIKVGAHRVFPAEVGAVLAECDSVVEVAVTAEPDTVLGEVVVAHVVMRTGDVQAARPLLAYCRSRLPDYMIPRRIYFHDDLPKTATGKIRIADLRAGTIGPKDSP